jgi:hypothetical protein
MYGALVFRMAQKLRRVFVTAVIVQYDKTILVRQFHRNVFRLHSRSDSVVVIRQLVATQNAHFAYETMIVTILESIRTFAVRSVCIRHIAVLVIREFSKARQLDIFLLAVLAPMGNDFICVGANVIALETVKVRRFVMRPNILVIGAVLIAAVHVRPKLLKVVAHQLVESFVSSGMLNKSRFITKAVEAIFSTAMEVALVVSIAAAWEVAVLVEAKLQVAVWH